MNPIPNPIHMVNGKIEVGHIDIPREVQSHVFSLFDDESNLIHSLTAFDDGKAGSRQSLETKVRSDITTELFMKLDTHVLITLMNWGEDPYAGVAVEQLMLYKDGAASPVHMDDQHGVPERIGKTKYLMHLYNQVAALMYISTDDLIGGELVFPEQDISVAPKTGTIVVFPSNYLYPHGVLPVIQGKRIAIGRHYLIKESSDA